MKPLISTLFSLLLIATAAATSAQEAGMDTEAERKVLQDARLKVLRKFFRVKPDAQAVLEGAKGYAIFTDLGLNFGLLSNQRGGGILRHNRTGVDLYYTMAPAGGSFAPDSRGFAAIFVFHSAQALAQFEQAGWDFTARTQAELAFESESETVETAASAVPEATIYRFSDTPIALQGARFWQDEVLNESPSVQAHDNSPGDGAVDGG